MTTKFTPGPYSVHQYSDVQTFRGIDREDGSSFETRSISIGCGSKLIGEVTMMRGVPGFPRIETEEELQATANLWIAAPALYEALEEARTSLSILRTQVMVEINRGVERWEGVPEKLKERLDAVDAALNLARGEEA